MISVVGAVDHVHNFGVALRRWRHATSYHHMLEMNIARLGEQQDRLHCEPLRQMLNAQIWLTHCGALTRQAQLGELVDDDVLEFRAAITMFADDDAVDWLRTVLAGSGYTMLVRERYVPNRVFAPLAGEVVVRAVLGQVDELTWWGAQETARQIRRAYPVRRDVARELYDLKQVTVYDPRWGDSDLFAFLYDAARIRQQWAAVGMPWMWRRP